MAIIAKDDRATVTLIQLHPLAISWKILPVDFILPDDPVEDNLQA